MFKRFSVFSKPETNPAFWGVDFKWLTASSVHTAALHITMWICRRQRILPLNRVCDPGGRTKTHGACALASAPRAVWVRVVCAEAFGALAFCGGRSHVNPVRQCNPTLFLWHRYQHERQLSSQDAEFTKNNCLPRNPNTKVIELGFRCVYLIAKTWLLLKPLDK